ncbi:MAG: hypothetical protein JST86_18725 [Bacteroidetes bacterium]|nr:hypothetical protein [Bacteroidota bacterium]
MVWTHIYDLLAKLLSLAITAVILQLLPLYDLGTPVIALITIGISVSIYIVFFRTLGSYCYCRWKLGMPVTFNEAKILNNALSPNPFRNPGSKWLTLQEVKSMQTEDKYASALQLLQQWEEKKEKVKQEESEKQQNKTAGEKFFEILTVVIIISVFLTVFFEQPPATYVIQYYCKLFDTQEYSPILIGGIMVLVILLPLLLIKIIFFGKKK